MGVYTVQAVMGYISRIIMEVYIYIYMLVLYLPRVKGCSDLNKLCVYYKWRYLISGLKKSQRNSNYRLLVSLVKMN